MPTKKKDASGKEEASKKKYYVRLRRLGQRGEMGLNRFYKGKRLYVRTKIYAVDAKTRAKLKATRKFEDILPEDLEQVKREMKAPSRGLTLSGHIRAKRREAMRRRRGETMPPVEDSRGAVEDDFGKDSGDDYSPPDDDSTDEDDGEEVVAV